MNIVAVIPARGGSKGIPGKNIKLLGDKPLIQYTIDAAKEVFKPDQIIVSTDNLEIKENVENCGIKVPFLRPAQLATDTAGTYEVLLHALSYYEKHKALPEVLVLLQPTSPFRTSRHINEALALFKTEKEIDMVVSVSETKSNPYYILFEEDEAGFLRPSKTGDFTRRQDCPKVWEYNGAIYVINVASLKKASFSSFSKIKKYEMDQLASLDLDTHADWLLAEILMKQKS